MAEEHANAELLTWAAVVRAVKALSRAHGPKRPGARLPSQAIAMEELAEAVTTLQALVHHTAQLFRACSAARDEHRKRPAPAPSLQASAAATIAAMNFIDGFADAMKSGSAEAFAELLEVLGELQAGRRKVSFSDLPPVLDARRTERREAAVWGLAACALDARLRANGGRFPKQEMPGLADMVARALGKQVLPHDLIAWRTRCMQGEQGHPKGFKEGHSALHRWQHYRREVVDSPLRCPNDRAGWLRVAAAFEAQIATAPASMSNDREKGEVLFQSVSKTG